MIGNCCLPTVLVVIDKLSLSRRLRLHDLLMMGHDWTVVMCITMVLYCVMGRVSSKMRLMVMLHYMRSTVSSWHGFRFVSIDVAHVVTWENLDVLSSIAVLIRVAIVVDNNRVRAMRCSRTMMVSGRDHVSRTLRRDDPWM